MHKDAVVQRVEALAKPIADELNYELYYVEYVREGGDNFLRIYIDKEGGIFLTDCEAMSRRVSDELDVEDFISDSYYLEVSSPGLNRGLFNDEHFKKALGREVLIKTKSGLEGKKSFSGVLKELTDNEIILEGNDNITIPKDKIKTANIDGEI